MDVDRYAMNLLRGGGMRRGRGEGGGTKFGFQKLTHSIVSSSPAHTTAQSDMTPPAPVASVSSDGILLLRNRSARRSDMAVMANGGLEKGDFAVEGGEGLALAP